MVAVAPLRRGTLHTSDRPSADHSHITTYAFQGRYFVCSIKNSLVAGWEPAAICMICRTYFLGRICTTQDRSFTATCHKRQVVRIGGLDCPQEMIVIYLCDMWNLVYVNMNYLVVKCRTCSSWKHRAKALVACGHCYRRKWSPQSLVRATLGGSVRTVDACYDGGRLQLGPLTHAPR